MLMELHMTGFLIFIILFILSVITWITKGLFRRMNNYTLISVLLSMICVFIMNLIHWYKFIEGTIEFNKGIIICTQIQPILLILMFILQLFIFFYLFEHCQIHFIYVFGVLVLLSWLSYPLITSISISMWIPRKEQILD